jgi:hypothetical protein
MRSVEAMTEHRLVNMPILKRIDRRDQSTELGRLVSSF